MVFKKFLQIEGKKNIGYGVGANYVEARDNAFGDIKSQAEGKDKAIALEDVRNLKIEVYKRKYYVALEYDTPKK